MTLKKKGELTPSTQSNHTLRSIEWGEEATGRTDFLTREVGEELAIQVGEAVQYPHDAETPEWKTYEAADMHTGEVFKLPTDRDLQRKIGSNPTGKYFKITYLGMEKGTNGHKQHKWTVIPAK